MCDIGLFYNEWYVDIVFVDEILMDTMTAFHAEHVQEKSEPVAKQFQSPEKLPNLNVRREVPESLQPQRVRMF